MISPAPAHATFSIRDLAEEFAVTARTLRFYEDKGLLHPVRRGQSRIYSANDRARLALILRGKRVGFSLGEIKEVIDLKVLGSANADALAETVARFEARVSDLEAQRADIDLAIKDLRAGCDWLRARLEGAEPSADLKRRAAAFEELARTWLYGGEGLRAAD